MERLLIATIFMVACEEKAVCPELPNLVEYCEPLVEEEIRICRAVIHATKEHCTEVLDCRYENFHPDQCDPEKCKYCAMERLMELHDLAKGTTTGE